MIREMTVKEFAHREQVTQRTVRTWIAKGAVPVRRTPGGGVRVLILGSEQIQQMKSDEDRGSLSR